MTDPTFVKVDLTELQDEGVLFHANEQFFWPLGLALTWERATVAIDKAQWCGSQHVHEPHDVPPYTQSNFEGHCAGTTATGAVRNLHVRQWEWEDGHIETIEDDGGDPTPERRRRFAEWLEARIEALPEGERRRAIYLYERSVGAWVL